jgi:hypothetical protein
MDEQATKMTDASTEDQIRTRKDPSTEDNSDVPSSSIIPIQTTDPVST